eukprot:m.392419 g.392419  ORF g.392419 m.392419 type:complete len:65 (-) comp28323_c0_seq11:203-397(-)
MWSGVSSRVFFAETGTLGYGGNLFRSEKGIREANLILGIGEVNVCFISRVNNNINCLHGHRRLS